MNFTFDPAKTQTTAPPSTATQSATGFSFGNNGAGDAAKTLTTSQTQPKPGGFFSSSLTGASTPAPTFGSGLSIGTSTTQQSATPAPGLAFGTNTTSTPALSLGFSMTTSTPVTGFSATGLRMPGTVNFSTPSTTNAAAPTSILTFNNTTTALTTTGFTLGTAATTTSAPALSFGLTAATTSASTGFSLGGNTATMSTPATMSFGLMSTSVPTPSSSLTTSTSTGLSLGTGNITAPTSTLGFNLSITTSATPTTSTFTLGAPTTTTASSLGSFLLPGTTSTTATTGFSLGNMSTANSAGFSLTKTTTAAPTSAISSSTPQTSLGTATTVSSSSSSGQNNTINFCQLEETMNKWTLELEEQEKVFMNQAAQVNAWDKLLITNGEKIVMLNQEVERVKLEQQQLEHELDYVVGQQKELQDCLVPLEKELSSLSVSDPEREYTYKLAEKIDTQLKRMSEDLKEIIEHLNEANRAQDSSDPIVQIGKILNAHMNSLQWLDQRTTVLAQNIQQIDQMHQNFRQENERSFSLAYN